MSRRISVTLSDKIGNEFEQYCYGKYGTTPSKALPGIVLAAMSKNPLTVQQTARIVREYGNDVVVLSEGLSASAEGTGTKEAGR